MIRSPLTFPELFRLPLVLDLRTAAQAFGFCQATAYRLIRDEEFPCPVLRVGYHYRVPTAGVLKALGIGELPVYTDDLARGVEHAEEGTEDQ